MGAKTSPGKNNRCGYSSLTALAKHLDPAIGARLLSQQVAEEAPGTAAHTLAQLADLAAVAKLPVRLARRSAKAAWVYPSLIHWKPGHFSVLLSREADGRFLIDDPGANTRRLVSGETLDEETSGACLIATSELPAGWGSLERGAAEAAIGRYGVTQSPDDDTSEGCSSCNGVAEADFNSFRASLVVSDTPLVDTPPRGPGNSVRVTWGQHSSSLLHQQSYTKLGYGTNWTLGYSAYVDAGSGNRVVFDGTGNRTTHILGSGSGGYFFYRQLLNQKTLEKVYSSGATFVGFKLKSEGGSYEEYFQPGKEAVNVEEKRYFLTRRVDAQGPMPLRIQII